MRNVLAELAGASVVMLPLITLIAWGLFRALYKNKPESRVVLVLLTCTITAIGLITMRQYGRQTGYGFTMVDWVTLLNGAIAAAIGTAFWKGPNPKGPVPPDPKTTI
jgi:hypothetical protein